MPRLHRSGLVAASLGVALFACAPEADGPAVPRDETSRAALGSGTWSPVSPMIQGRDDFVAALLPDGKVLVAGGTGSGAAATSAAEIFDPATNVWTSAQPMTQVRTQHAAVLLQDGKVLVAGGTDAALTKLKTAELYDPIAGTWTAIAPMTNSRNIFGINLLQSGKALAIGGWGSGSTAELFDPDAGTWSTTINAPVSGHPCSFGGYPAANAGSVVLSGGRVLEAAGQAIFGTGNCSNSAIFDPSTGAWDAGASLPAAISGNVLVRLTTGDVLTASGNNAYLFDPVGNTWTATTAPPVGPGQAALLPNGEVLALGLNRSSIYDPFPSTPTWTPLAVASTYHDQGVMVLLPNDEVLTLGGTRTLSDGGVVYTNLVDMFDPTVPAVDAGPSLPLAVESSAASWLPSGALLVTGGSNGTAAVASATSFDPVGGLSAAVSPMGAPRSRHTQTLLPSGKVLVTGGEGGNAALASCELFDPNAGTWTATGSLQVARSRHTATLLPDGRVLVAGGFDGTHALASAEIYDPQAGTWSATLPLDGPRQLHTATLLRDGRVLIAGGQDDSALVTSALLFDPSTLAFTPTAAPSTPRVGQAMVMLPSGTILMAGGETGASTTGTAEIFDPDGGVWIPTGSLNVARSHPLSTLLPGGKVLLAGGWSGTAALSSTELYEPLERAWEVGPNLSTARFEGVALGVGTTPAYLFGGETLDSTRTHPTSTVEVFDEGRQALPSTVPVINTGTLPTLSSGNSFSLSGSTFSGFAEGASGTSQTSAANAPLVWLRREDNLSTHWAPTTAWTSTSLTATLPGVRSGWWSLAVISNAVPSAPKPVLVANRGATRLAFTAQPQTVPAGSVFPQIAVGQFDVLGAAVSGSLSVTLALANNPDGGALNGALNASGTSGVASFSGLSMTQAGTGYTLLATAPGLDAAMSQPFSITAAAPTQLLLTSPPRTFTAGVCGGSGAALTFALADGYGNAAPAPDGGVSFTVATTSGGGAFFADPACATPPTRTFTIPTASSGTSVYYLDTVAGSPSLSTSSSLTNPSPQTETVNPGLATALNFASYPLPLTAGVCSASALVVEQTDAFNNPVVSASGEWIGLSSSSDAGLFFAVSGCAAPLDGGIAMDAGSASVSFFYRDTQAATVTLIASAAGLSPASQMRNVLAGPVQALRLSGFPSRTTAGTPGNLEVDAIDAYGNLNFTYSGSIAVSSSDPAASLPAPYAYQATDNGAHVFSVTLNTVGTQSLTATDTQDAGLTATQSGIQVVADAGAFDAGGGSSDAGGGSSDAGVDGGVDAGDGGNSTSADGGRADAGPDAGRYSVPGAYQVGFGCGASPGTPAVGLLFLLALSFSWVARRAPSAARSRRRSG